MVDTTEGDAIWEQIELLGAMWQKTLHTPHAVIPLFELAPFWRATRNASRNDLKTYLLEQQLRRLRTQQAHLLRLIRTLDRGFTMSKLAQLDKQ